MERWTMETGGERASGKSVLAAWHDDDEDFMRIIVIYPDHC